MPRSVDEARSDERAFTFCSHLGHSRVGPPEQETSYDCHYTEHANRPLSRCLIAQQGTVMFTCPVKSETREMLRDYPPLRGRFIDVEKSGLNWRQSKRRFRS